MNTGWSLPIAGVRPAEEGGKEMDNNQADRRGFLRTGAIAGTALVAGASGAFAQGAGPSRPPEGDIVPRLSILDRRRRDLVEDAAHLTADFMRRSFGVASGDFGLCLV